MRFVANFMRFAAVHKFWKSVKIWQSYRQLKVGTLLLSNANWSRPDDKKFDLLDLLYLRLIFGEDMLLSRLESRYFGVDTMLSDWQNPAASGSQNHTTFHGNQFLVYYNIQ